MKIYFFYIILVFNLLNAQQYTQADVEVCKQKFNLSIEKNLSEESINKVIEFIGRSFIGLDYEAGSLDKNENEELVVHLTGLDCYTFLESTLVFARLIKKQKYTFEDYQDELTQLRYREGKICEYPSRLHYFSDWIYEMDKRGITKDITKDIGGEPYSNIVNFMSSHPDYYKQLKGNESFVNEMRDIEKVISSRKYFYIPQDKIKIHEKKIMSGDIVGITTNIDGLDISHTGIAVRLDDDRIHLLHAPKTGKKIQITAEPLAEYIKRNSKQTGIIISRPLEP